MFRNEMNSEGH